MFCLCFDKIEGVNFFFVFKFYIFVVRFLDVLRKKWELCDYLMCWILLKCCVCVWWCINGVNLRLFFLLVFGVDGMC